MSESEKFTIDDAENDGLIKREVGRQMVSNLKRSAPTLWQMFEKVCENQDRRPQEVMGDHALRAINDQSHSEMLADIRVDLSEVNKDQIRIEDAKFINQVTEELGLNKEEKEDPIDKLIERRLEAKTGPMLPGSEGRNRQNVDGEVRQELDSINEQMQKLQSKLSGDEVSDGSDESDKDVDELFSETSDEDNVEETEEIVEEESVKDEESEVDVDEFLEEDSDGQDEVDDLLGGSDEASDETAEEDYDDEALIEPDGIIQDSGESDVEDGDE